MLTPEIINFVRQQQKDGFPKETTRSNLLAHGWSELDINEAFIESAKTELQESRIRRNSTGYVQYTYGGGGGFLGWFTGISVIIALVVFAWFGYQKFINPVLETDFDVTRSNLIQPRGGSGFFENSPAKKRDPRLEFVPYVTRDFSFRINQPKDWEIFENPNPDTVVVFTPKGESTLSLEVAIPVLANGKTLEDVSATIRKTFASISGLKLLGESPLMLSGKPATVFETEYKNKHNKILLMVENEQIYFVTASGSLAQWGQNKDLLQVSLATFVP